MIDALPLSVTLPLLGALAVTVSPAHARGLGLLAAVLTAASGVAVTAAVWSDGVLRADLGGWGVPLGIALEADGLSAAFLAMANVVALAISVYAGGYFKQETAQHFWPLWLLLWSALNGLFLATDLFNLYVTLELLGLSAAALGALTGTREAVAANLRYLLVGLLGSMSYLLGVALVYAAYGVLDIGLVAEAIAPGPVAWTAMALMIGGLILKAALFPMHFWLPPAHANAPAPVSAALSALVCKAAFYLVLRLWLDVFAPVLNEAAANLLGMLGAAAVVWGSWRALRAERLKLLAAYSTVAQVGYLFIAFPLLAATPPGLARDNLLAAVVLLALTHGFAKAGFFLAAGMVQKTAGHDRIDDLGGAAQALPAATFAIGLAGVALIGLPPSGTFLAKWMMLEQAMILGHWWWLVVMMIGTLLAAAYIFRVLSRAFNREPAPYRFVNDARTELPALLLGLIATFGLGIAAQPLWVLLEQGVRMSFDAWLPAAILLSSMVPGMLIFLLREESHRLRTLLNMTGALVKLGLVIWMIGGVYDGQHFETRWTLAPGLDLVLSADALSVLFVALSTLLWLVTTIYAIGYLEHSPNRSRFFGFFSICVSATVGIALSGNLLTFVIFYEILTLATYPLVAHRGTPDAAHGAKVYLAYTVGGGALLLVGAIWLQALVGPVEFTPGGILGVSPEEIRMELILIFFVLLAGLGVKAALVPLHGWLPQAMVAPAPVSALLHAVAVVKAGAFGILRVVYDVYGVEFAYANGLLLALGILASVTVIYGSMMALTQDNLKKRLAYSTVSQVSYIALGASIFGPIATIGGMVHLVHQGLMKITLFFCAGNYAETLGVHKVSEMDGVGRRMPWTSLAFTVGALGMIGVPPIAGFVSKWYLGLGAADAGSNWVLAVLVASSLLNAAYFLPILHRAWFRPAPKQWPQEHRHTGRMEIAGALLWPPVITAVLALSAGLFAAAPFTPLEWATLIAEREYGR